MLEVHPPHEPVHGWRDFLIHLFTIRAEEAAVIKNHFEILQGQLMHVEALIVVLDDYDKKFLTAHPE